MTTKYRIHPAIGLARVGDSPEDFYLAPESPASLPIACDRNGQTTRDPNGKEETTSSFKDSQCRVKRQGARFKIFVYDDENPAGRELALGDTIEGIGSRGKLVDIEWTVHLANKKAVWYQFKELEGEHGYAADHPLRNASITGENARQRLIIDPGRQSVWNHQKPQRAAFARGANPSAAQTFPPPLEPHSVETLGEILTDGEGHLIVLGGHGNSGTCAGDFGQPRIDHFANNDGWFDDVSDGPVTARLKYWDELDQQYRYAQVEDPAWVIVGQPGYVPELLNLVTLDDVLHDLAVRHFAYDTYLYGTGPFDRQESVDPEDEAALAQWRQADKRYNPDYYPLFYKEIWPLLQRPHSMMWVSSFVDGSFDPHETGPGGNFDETKISVPPHHGQDPKQRALFAEMRQYVYDSLRQPGDENRFLNHEDPDSRLYGSALMPLLCGDNPLSNNVPSKFLRLTDTQLFLLEQWAKGRFINEKLEGFDDSHLERRGPGEELDRAVLANALGGAFCPGGEVSWIIRNPAIYKAPYRINANLAYLPHLETSSVATTPGVELYERPALNQQNKIGDGLEPGDLTKYGPLPWQADFNECSTQPIDVTYEAWCQINPEDPDNRTVESTLWWPAHRPMQVYIQRVTAPGEDPQFDQVDWSRGVPQNAAGDLRMVTAWKDLGFVVKNDALGGYAEVARNDDALGGEKSEQGCSSED